MRRSVRRKRKLAHLLSNAAPASNAPAALQLLAQQRIKLARGHAITSGELSDLPAGAASNPHRPRMLQLLPLQPNWPIRSRVAEIAPASETAQTGAGRESALPAEARLRDSELFLLVLALAAGVAAGIGVVLMDLLLALLRWIAFGISSEGHLSDIDLGPARVLLIPVLGGLLVGLLATLLRRWRPREVVDAIEANALLGGRMSVSDSVGLVAVTILSGGFGASVGLEAAYTQLGAALTGALVVRGLVGSTPIFVVWHEISISASDYPGFFGLGLASAGLGILVMKGVTSTEALFRSLAVPRWARPALGGLLIGALALPFPQILGSGHGGIM